MRGTRGAPPLLNTIVTLVALAFSLACIHLAAAGTTLESLAASMQPGTWVAVPQTNIDAVLAHAELADRRERRGAGLEPGVEGGQRRPLTQSAVRSALVVVGAKGLELRLKVRERSRSGLLRQEALQRLVKALHLAAGLRVIGARVHRADAKPRKLRLKDHRPAARAALKTAALSERNPAGRPLLAAAV